jgi:hypothetical protein
VLDGTKPLGKFHWKGLKVNGKIKPDLRETACDCQWQDAETVSFYKICNLTFTALLVFLSASSFQKIAVCLMGRKMSQQVLFWAVFFITLLWICQGNARQRNFVHRKDI